MVVPFPDKPGIKIVPAIQSRFGDRILFNSFRNSIVFRVIQSVIVLKGLWKKSIKQEQPLFNAFPGPCIHNHNLVTFILLNILGTWKVT